MNTNTRPNDRALARAERLTEEIYGRGYAISLDDSVTSSGRGVIARIWNPLGHEVVACPPRKTRTDAIKLLIQTLVEDLE